MRLPVILSQEEVQQMINASSDLFQRYNLMTLYSTGMRRSELTRLMTGDIDSKRRVVHIHLGRRYLSPLPPWILITFESSIGLSNNILQHEKSRLNYFSHSLFN
jgi:integrase